MTAIDVLLYLGGRHSLHRSCQWIHYSACVGGWCLARVRRRWVSGNAVADGSRLRTPARWVRVLAFGALARRESSSMACGLLRRAHATSETSGSTDKAVTGYGGPRSGFLARGDARGHGSEGNGLRVGVVGDGGCRPFLRGAQGSLRVPSESAPTGGSNRARAQASALRRRHPR